MGLRRNYQLKRVVPILAVSILLTASGCSFLASKVVTAAAVWVGKETVKKIKKDHERDKERRHSDENSGRSNQ